MSRLPCTTPAAAGVVLLVLAFLLSACAAPQASGLLAGRPAELPVRALLAQVPFHAQERFQCGPAALAMMLGASGVSTTPDELQALVYLPAREGSLQPEMLAAARRHGRLAVVLPPRLDAVLQEIAAGRPAIVLQNLALPIAPQWHYAVVIGYDLDRGDIVLHSGLTEAQRLPFDVFERTWARSGYWAMVADRPDRLPRSPAVEALVAAAVALERVDARAAITAYETLTLRAPRSMLAWIGLGNTAYAVGDFRRSVAAFQDALALDASAADVWNNLAQALLAIGDAAQARAAAERAIEIGGERSARYRATLVTIERAGR